ncbi:FadR/GntR family transcriptional regulator [Litorihabitans aurantiacus]|uniref:FadR/GntR family transcriptional regulator n=1 Tax=Litorihabitans aurantiacus TaxID=1930061 RepID=UPI003D67DFB3
MRRTPADVDRLRTLRATRLGSWQEAEPELRARADLDLHRAVVVATHNPLYLQLYSSMIEVFAVHMRDEDAEVGGAHELHHDLVEAIAQGEADRAVAVVSEIFRPHTG